MSGLVRVDYAGPGGTCEGMRMLGLQPVGIEWDRAACATRAAAGHLTIRADLATYRPHHELGSVEGYWASPPCQTFSTAGKGGGRGQVAALVSVIDREDWDAAGTFDARTRHVIDAARTACTIGARWVGMEQVQAALPVFQAVARRLRARGYAVWVGKVNAADHGVPQTRIRVFLIARSDGIAERPEPTHAAQPAPDLFGTLRPWVTMADWLGWPEGGTVTSGQAVAGGPLATRTADAPAFTVGSRVDQWRVSWPYLMPATTVAGDPRISARCHHEPGEQGRDARTTDQVRAGHYSGTQPIRLTHDEAASLQSFPAGYPFQGNSGAVYRQIGDAVPPLLAAHVVAAASGRTFSPEPVLAAPGVS